MDVGVWIGISSLTLSAALAFNGYRGTRVTQFRQRIEDLEEQVEELKQQHLDCQSDLRRERREKAWLMAQLARDRPGGDLNP